MARIETWLKCDLKKLVTVQYLQGNIFSQDNQANLIGVELYDNGTAVTASGTVTANIIREDGATVTATGSVSGNKASVVLPAAAYAIPGAIAIIIKITLSGVITTIAAVVGTVYRSTTDTPVDPGTIMPSIQTLISQIQTAVASIPADYSSLWTSLAPAFSASTNYAAGQYVTNNGKVYRFNTAHTAGAWVASEVTEVKLGNEISGLNAALAETISPNKLDLSAISEYSSTKSVTDLIQCEKSYVAMTFLGSQGTRVQASGTTYNFYDTTKTFIESRSSSADRNCVEIPSGAVYVRAIMNTENLAVEKEPMVTFFDVITNDYSNLEYEDYYKKTWFASPLYDVAELEDRTSALEDRTSAAESDINKNAEDVNNLKSAFIQINSDNKLDLSTVSTYSPSKSMTDFIKCEKSYVALTFLGNNGTRAQASGTQYNWYNEDKTYLSNSFSDSTRNNILIPDNAVYVRVILSTVSLAAEKLPMVTFFDTSTNNYTDLEYEEYSIKNWFANPLYDIANVFSDKTTIEKVNTFENGTIYTSSGVFHNNNAYRVATPNSINLNKDYIVNIDADFRLLVSYFENDTYIKSSYVSSGFVLLAKYAYKFTIMRKEENTSETANIKEFTSKIVLVPVGAIDDIDSTIKNANALKTYGIAWDWWITSHSIDDFANTYIGYIDTNAMAGVMRKQSDGTVQYKPLAISNNADDHNGMGTLVLDDGRILVAGSYGHSTNNHIICFRSKMAYSIDDMEDISFDIPQTGEYTYKTTYSQLFKYDGKIFMFFRSISFQNDTNVGVAYGCAVSSDNANTWTIYKAFGNGDVYFTLAQATDNPRYIKGIYSKNPSNASMSRGFYLDLETYLEYDLSGTQIGQMVELNGGATTDDNIAHIEEMTQLVQMTTGGKYGRLLYCANTALNSTVFLYAIATDETNKDFVYKIYKDGTIIDVGHSGVPFGNYSYISGACFGNNPNTVFYIKANTNNAEGSHELHKVVINNNAVENDVVIATTSICAIRPLYLGNGELAMLVGKYNDQNDDGTYSGSFTKWTLNPLFVNE